MIALSVIDEGAGIPADKIDEIFEMFHQLDNSTTRRHGGTGLGLSIVKGLVELMGGKITVKSEVGRGSCFTVEIPFEIYRPVEDKTSPVPAPKIAAFGGGKIRVLLAEDEEICRRLVQSLGRRFGWEVTGAGNGAKAVELFKNGYFDAVLMDGQMPEMDGFEAAMKIREIEAATGGHIPIIALTAYAMEGDREKFIAAGMDDYVTKPITDENILYSTVMKHIKSERLQ